MPTSLESRGSLETLVLEPPFQPLMSEAANEYFGELLSPTDLVCEYGCGSSTIWLAERTAKVYSVEHDPVWHGIVARAIEEQKIANVQLNLVVPAVGGNLREAAKRYSEFLLNFPDDHFDIIYLDGWRPSRPAAPAIAKDKVRPGGWLVIDNLEWSPVVNGIKFAGIESWERYRCSGKTAGYIPGISIGPLVCHAGFYQRPETDSHA